MSKRRVVVTGLGMVSPLGINVADTWQAILAGKSGVGIIDAFDTSQLTTRFSASVRDFDHSAYLLPKEARKFDVFIQYAVEASGQALKDAGLEVNDNHAERAGAAIGSGIGGIPFIQKNNSILEASGPRRVSPFFIPGTIINMAAGLVSIKFNLKGPNISIVTACATGVHNIGHAARIIEHDDADVMIAGGSEMATTPLCISGFASARALSTRNDAPEKASRPWDKDRDGFVLGDGAGIVVLEEYEHAKARGVNIYAEVVGFGMSADAYHFTAPSVEGMAFAIKNTLRDANLNPDDVQYINAHATSTEAGDVAEVNAIKQVFSDHAAKLMVSSTKSMTGHLLGAAGAIESIFSVLALRDQIIPPTINLDEPGEGCDLDFVPHTAREAKLEYVLSNSFGFGGTNGGLLFRKI